MHILVKKTECAGIRWVKTNENLTAHLFVPGQRILLRETTVTETGKTWRIEIEQRSLYVCRDVYLFSPFARRKAKIVHNFGLSECKRVKVGMVPDVM